MHTNHMEMFLPINERSPLLVSKMEHTCVDIIDIQEKFPLWANFETSTVTKLYSLSSTAAVQEEELGVEHMDTY